MQIEKIITSKTTGYASALGLGGTIISGISKNRNFRRFHTPFAYATIGLSALHISIIEYYHNKYKKM